MNFLIGLGEVLLVVVILFILGIVINLVMRRGGATIPTAITPSKKTLMNAGWMLGTYALCLWAFSAIWPTAWHAWRGEGFWVTQLLFISAIGFLASVWMRTRGLHWLSIIPVVMAILLTVVTTSRNWPESKDKPVAKIPDTKPTTKTPQTPPKPPVVDTTFRLKAGDTTMRYKSYDGWVLATGATGRYQHQVDDGPWLIRGDGSEEKNLQGGTVRLTPVDSTIMVRVVYRQTN